VVEDSGRNAAGECRFTGSIGAWIVESLGPACDGLLNLDKPVRLTSAKALYRVRSLLKQRKSGHAGTLDPAASGVLLICLGRATKFVERIMDLPKVYRATARLDVTSESFDSDRPHIPVEFARQPTIEVVRSALAAFEGGIQQVPPSISAVKVGGVPAYRHARKGTAITLAPRAVRVYWIALHDYRWPNLDFEICCSRGTYVRGLIRDLGVALQTGGCLTALSRTAIGPFKVEEAWTLEALAAHPERAHGVIPLAQATTMIEAGRGLIPARPSS